MTNIIQMPEPMDKIGRRIDEAYEQTQRGHQQWIEGTLDLALALAEAKGRFPSTVAFSGWLGENGHDHVDKNDRAALISMASADAIEITRIVLTETKRINWRLIWEEEIRPRVSNATNSTKTESPPPETDPTPSTTAISQPMPVKDHTQHKNPAIKGRKPALVELHGDTGEAVLDWIRSLLAGKPLSYAMLSRALAKLKTNTLKQMLAFIEAHRDGLRPALNAEAFSAAIFWKDIPFELSKDISGHLIKPDQIIGKVIADWDVRIAPVMRDWIAGGMPENSREWYRLRDRKPVPMAAPVITAELRAEAVAVGIDMDDPRFSSLPEQSIRQIVDNKTRSREYANEHSLFKLPEHPTAIRVFGHDIWPCPPQQHWTWRDAFYAYHLWLEADTHLQVYEKRANVRGRTLMNPFVPILTNINGAVGAAFKEMVWAQFHDDAKESDTFGPPKMLLFQGE